MARITRTAAAVAGGPGDRDRDSPVAAYKRLLQSYIDRRPSGTRRKIAIALGKHKSFVSQITSPSYAVPLPEAHVDTILAICHFSPEERETFLAAYLAAHPGRLHAVPDLHAGSFRKLHIDVPRFDDPHTQDEVESLIRGFAQRVIRLAKRGEE